IALADFMIAPALVGGHGKTARRDPASAGERPSGRTRLQSNSTRTCPCCTASPTLTLILATLPAMGAVITVSIFMASRIRRTSFTRMVCPAWAEILDTVPEKGLRQTLPSSATGALPPEDGAEGLATGAATGLATGAAAGTRACAGGDR